MESMLDYYDPFAFKAWQEAALLIFVMIGVRRFGDVSQMYYSIYTMITFLIRPWLQDFSPLFYAVFTAVFIVVAINKEPHITMKQLAPLHFAVLSFAAFSFVQMGTQTLSEFMWPCIYSLLGLVTCPVALVLSHFVSPVWRNTSGKIRLDLFIGFVAMAASFDIYMFGAIPWNVFERLLLSQACWMITKRMRRNSRFEAAMRTGQIRSKAAFAESVINDSGVTVQVPFNAPTNVVPQQLQAEDAVHPPAPDQPLQPVNPLLQLPISPVLQHQA